MDSWQSLDEQQARLESASRFAAVYFRRFPELLDELRGSGDLERSYSESDIASALASRLQGCDDSSSLSRILRRFRLREMLRILWRDFNRLAPTLETTRDTSLLAEACVQQTLDWWHRALAEEHGEPCDSAGRPQRLLVLAMGKLGARALNVSSDIDLIFAYP